MTDVCECHTVETTKVSSSRTCLSQSMPLPVTSWYLHLSAEHFHRREASLLVLVHFVRCSLSCCAPLLTFFLETFWICFHLQQVPAEQKTSMLLLSGCGPLSVCSFLTSFLRLPSGCFCRSKGIHAGHFRVCRVLSQPQWGHQSEPLECGQRC